MDTKPIVLELVGGQFKPVEWADFVRLTVREICRRPFVLKTHGLYFVGDSWGTNIDRIVAKKHPGKIRSIMEWLVVVLPYWSADLMDEPLIGLPMRKINEGNASEVLARIQELARQNREVNA